MLVRLPQKCCPTLGPPVQEFIEKLEQVYRSAAKMVGGLERMICEEMLRDMGLGSLVKRWLRRVLKPACTYMKGNDKEMEPNSPR